VQNGTRRSCRGGLSIAVRVRWSPVVACSCRFVLADFFASTTPTVHIEIHHRQTKSIQRFYDTLLCASATVSPLDDNATVGSTYGRTCTRTWVVGGANNHVRTDGRPAGISSREAIHPSETIQGAPAQYKPCTALLASVESEFSQPIEPTKFHQRPLEQTNFHSIHF
jgi:hypothetical protein